MLSALLCLHQMSRQRGTLRLTRHFVSFIAWNCFFQIHIWFVIVTLAHNNDKVTQIHCLTFFAWRFCLKYICRRWSYDTSDVFLQINAKCSRLKHVDLSYCTGLLDDSTSFSLGSFPVSVQELSLCGTVLKDAALLTKALTRLTSLRRVNLCGVTALTDEALEEVCIILYIFCCSIIHVCIGLSWILFA